MERPKNTQSSRLQPTTLAYYAWNIPLISIFIHHLYCILNIEIFNLFTTEENIKFLELNMSK